MAEALKLMCVLAHPDDESLGTGGILAKYAAEGVETYLVTATRGERGWWGEEKDYPGLEALGRIREAELRAAAEVLGLREVRFLDYVDGDLDRADPPEAIGRIAAHLRRVRPQVVVTFGPDGAYGHPDHIAICQFTTAAAVCAADADYQAEGGDPPHRVSKLYYMADSRQSLDAAPEVFAAIRITVDGVVRGPVPWEDWAITTRVDARAYGLVAWQAFACHRSQVPSLPPAEDLTPEQIGDLLGLQSYYRAFSVVNGGRAVETDLFEGLR
jgi:LmbE family N-acetylglucosaminyl deacetylase